MYYPFISIRPDNATKLQDRLHQFPSIAKCMDMIWFKPLEHDALVDIATTALKKVLNFRRHPSGYPLFTIVMIHAIEFIVC
jgi:hypothetical protein